jgi:hypothetical protein
VCNRAQNRVRYFIRNGCNARRTAGEPIRNLLTRRAAFYRRATDPAGACRAEKADDRGTDAMNRSLHILLTFREPVAVYADFISIVRSDPVIVDELAPETQPANDCEHEAA